MAGLDLAKLLDPRFIAANESPEDLALWFDKRLNERGAPFVEAFLIFARTSSRLSVVRGHSLRESAFARFMALEDEKSQNLGIGTAEIHFGSQKPDFEFLEGVV